MSTLQTTDYFRAVGPGVSMYTSFAGYNSPFPAAAQSQTAAVDTSKRPIFTETYLSPRKDNCPWIVHGNKTRQILDTVQGDVDPRFVWEYMLTVLDHTIKVDKTCNLDHVRHIIQGWMDKPRDFVDAYRAHSCNSMSKHTSSMGDIKIVEEVLVHGLDSEPDAKTDTKTTLFKTVIHNNLRAYVAVVTMGDIVSQLQTPTGKADIRSELFAWLAKAQK